MARMDGRRALVATLAISGEEDTTRPCMCVLAMQKVALPLATLQLPSFVKLRQTSATAKVAWQAGDGHGQSRCD